MCVRNFSRALFSWNKILGMNKAKRSVGMAKFPYDRGAVLEGLIDGGNSTQIFQGGIFSRASFNGMPKLSVGRGFKNLPFFGKKPDQVF